VASDTDTGTTSNDTGTAGNDTGTAGNDTGTAGNDTGTAGNDTGTAGNDSATLSGIAAAGAPCAGGSVTAQNSSGTAATEPVIVAADGTFQGLQVAMGSPYLLQAIGCLGDRALPLYSYLDSDSHTPTVNITTLTDATLRMAANTNSLDSVWSGWKDTTKPIAAANITLAQQKLLEQLQGAGSFDPNTFADINVFTTPFTANGQGIDMVMDSLSEVTVANGTLTMSVNGHTIHYTLPSDMTGTLQDHAGSATCVADLTMNITTPVAMTFPYTVCYTNIEANACSYDLEAQVKESMASITTAYPGASLTVNSYGTAAACPANTTVTVDFASGTVTTGTLGPNIPGV
jgi:hypothetical protein